MGKIFFIIGAWVITALEVTGCIPKPAPLLPKNAEDITKISDTSQENTAEITTPAGVPADEPTTTMPITTSANIIHKNTDATTQKASSTGQTFTITVNNSTDQIASIPGTTNLSNNTNTTQLAVTPVITGITPDTRIPGDNITSDTKPTLIGTGTKNHTLNIFGGETLIGTATVDNAGKWSFILSSSLTDGIYTFTAQDTITLTTSQTLRVTIDSIAPTVAPTHLDLVNDSDTGLSNTDNITSKTTPIFTGNAEANATVELLKNGISLGTTTANGSGAWTFEAPSINDGTYTITAREIDTAGNTGPSSSGLVLTIDTSITSGTPDLVTSSDSNINNDNITNDNTPTLSGTTEVGATIEVFDGSLSLGLAPVDGFGNWSLTTSISGEGIHNITAKATDLAGNTLTSGPLAITLDTIIPSAASSFSYDLGISPLALTGPGKFLPDSGTALTFIIGTVSIFGSGNFYKDTAENSSTELTTRGQTFTQAEAQNPGGVHFSGSSSSAGFLTFTVMDVAGNTSTTFSNFNELF